MATVMIAHVCVTTASHLSLRFERLVGSRPTPLVHDGRSSRDGLRVARMNDGDLEVALRRHGGIARTDIHQAQIEPTGEVSLLPVAAARIARRRDLASERAA
jgi:uncharacterized membrane protein YcaP (DUF421 family)